MLRFVVALSLFAVGYCNICCIPQQWEGTQSTLTGLYMDGEVNTTLEQESVNVSYDAVNQRIAASHYVDYNSGQAKLFAMYILDYRSGVQYTFDATRCRRTTLGNFVESCIPDDAKSGGSSYIGAGPGKVDVTHYTFMRYNLTVDMSVMPGCVPMGELIRGRFDGGFIHAAAGFTGITGGIRDVSVFTPPAMCANSPLYASDLTKDRRRMAGIF